MTATGRELPLCPHSLALLDVFILRPMPTRQHMHALHTSMHAHTHSHRQSLHVTHSHHTTKHGQQYTGNNPKNIHASILSNQFSAKLNTDANTSSQAHNWRSEAKQNGLTSSLRFLSVVETALKRRHNVPAKVHIRKKSKVSPPMKRNVQS